MKRKQQVGECWVCVIFFACVCVGASDSTTVSDNPSSSVLCVMCAGRFPGGVGMPPPVTRNVQHWALARGSAPIFFLGRFLLFLVVL
jgi:hypothetical protein